MKYHSIQALNEKERQLFIKDLIDYAFSDIKDGQTLNIGELIGTIIKAVDYILERQIK